MNKEITYPIFLSLIQHCQEECWKLFFTDMAYGILPYGVYIKNNEYIYCNIKQKKFSYIYYNKDALDIYNNLYIIFKEKFNIFKTLQHITTLGAYDSWASIKKKMIKSILINEFLKTQQIKYDLSSYQINKLFTNINLGIYFHLLNSINFDQKECKIISIDGIKFEQNLIYFQNIFV